LVCTIRSGRLPGELFEHAIELRERLEPNCECDLADPKVAICQKFARLFEAGTRDVFDKIYPSDLLEPLAKMIPANAGRFRYLAERKFFGRMSLDELSRFPDLYRFGSIAIARWLGESICGCCYHRTPIQPQLASLGCSSIGNVWSDLGTAQQAPAFGLSNFCKAKDKERRARNSSSP
jgi:DNA-binding XRE family transcriptional regulator